MRMWEQGGRTDESRGLREKIAEASDLRMDLFGMSDFGVLHEYS